MSSIDEKVKKLFDSCERF